MTRKLSEEELLLASQLPGAGIPLDGEVLEGMQTAGRGLSIFQTGTIADTRIFDLDSGQMALMLLIAICNDSPRIVWIHEYRVEIPWWEPHFRWLEDPARKIPREYTYSVPSLGPAGFDRDDVLNHRLRRNGRLNPDGWLEGLLLGVGQEPIPSNYLDRQPLVLRLWVFDEQGNRFGADVKLLVDRSALRAREKKLGQRKLARTRELLHLPTE